MSSLNRSTRNRHTGCPRKNVRLKEVNSALLMLCLAHRWGAGCAHFKSYSCGDAIEFGNYLDNLLVTFGGIYIASSVADSCRVWNCGVRPEAIHKYK